MRDRLTLIIKTGRDARKAVALSGLREGILPDWHIRALADAGQLLPAEPFVEAQVQPASLDLRLGNRAYRVRASFLPGPDLCVAERLPDLALHEIDLSEGAVLETGCVYIVPLLEALALPQEIAASTNPKSSTGRLDVFTRVITDRARSFDQMPAGYQGPLYLEISPRTFPIIVRRGSRLSQIRLPTCTRARRWRRAKRASSTGWLCRSICKATAAALSATGANGIPASSTSTSPAPMRFWIFGNRSTAGARRRSCSIRISSISW
jgi:deoxycytidine triphosphate deaminase